MYTHIIWDFDGTLFDTYPMMTDAFKLALEDEGIYEDRNNIILHMKVSEANVMEYYKKHYGISNTFKERYDRYRKDSDIKAVKPYDNVSDICKDIFTSNKYNYLYTHRGVSALNYLKCYDMYKHFCDFITRENSFKRKPEPDALLYLIEKHNIEPHEAIMIGDRDIDILAAKNAGIRACYFSNETTMESQHADYNINNIKQLYEIIGIK